MKNLKSPNTFSSLSHFLPLTNTPVFFMADVSELRIELIFPRSTLARLTPRGVVGALVTLVDVGVTGAAVVVVVAAGEAAATGLKTFVGVVGSFNGVSDFEDLETDWDGLSFLSSRGEKEKVVVSANHYN